MNKTTTDIRQSEQSTNTTPDNGANNQPTVNERLDEIVRKAYHGEVSWIHDQLDGTSFVEEALRDVEKNIIDTKQAITSLTKELVAEAKPKDYPVCENSPNQSVSRWCNKNKCWTCRERDNYELWGGIGIGIEKFEQNLLKALEEA